MYKNILKGIGLFSLIGFSFFYSEKVITVIKEKDPIMIKLEEIKDSKQISPVDAIVTDTTIIPGICGKVIDVEKSYNNMKKLGMYNANYLEYEVSCTQNNLNNNFDKYIISGNKLTNNVSLIFVIDEDRLLDKTLEIADKYNVPLNFFTDYQYMNENISKIYKLSKNNEIYNYADHGKYNNESLEIGNNIIERVTKRKAKYCLTEKNAEEVLKICQDKKMHTLVASPIKDNLYSNIKKNLTNGQMINIYLTDQNVNELDNTINFILKKGFNIVRLSELLTE